MDQVDKQLNEYIEGLVADCVASPAFASLTEERKKQIEDSIRDYLYKIIVETVVGALDEAQFSQIENLDPSSKEMADKIQDFASKIPGLHKIIEQKLAGEVAGIKNRQPLDS